LVVNDGTVHQEGAPLVDGSVKVEVGDAQRVFFASEERVFTDSGPGVHGKYLLWVVG
jgi:hypothetical protein